MKRLITLIILAALISCEQKPSDHPVFKYYPPEDVFNDGYVSKFYYHYYPDNPDQRAGSEIGYTKYTKLNQSRYKTKNYNAGFDLESERIYIVQGDSIVLEGGFGIRNYTDTTELNALSNSVSSWRSAMSNPYRIQYTYGEKEYIFTEYQTSVSDTTINNKPAKVFENKWNYREVGSDSIFSEGISKSFYVQGLGFFGSSSKGEDYSQNIELVEQMSVEEFEERTNHNEHRVAWIDPENTLSDDSDFKICGHQRNIADYYNSTPDGRYIHSKKALVDTIDINLDKSKLFNQSGRLVFRFVVNCEGKPGRFIAKGYDLDYQPIEFEKETVDHLFSIMEKLEEWQPVLIREETRDAYFYITFNLVNGEITDILP